MNEYSQIKYNPFDIPAGMTIWRRYPELGRRPRLSTIPKEMFKKKEEVAPTEADLSKLVSFVILMTDPKSPHYKTVDMDLRIVDCLEALRLTKTSLVYRLVSEMHWWVNSVITDYFIMLNNVQFEFWFSLKINAHFSMALLRKPFEASQIQSRSTLTNAIASTTKQLEELEQMLFTDPIVKEIVVETVTSTLHVPYAELHAKDFVV